MMWGVNKQKAGRDLAVKSFLFSSYSACLLCIADSGTALENGGLE